MIVIMKKNNNTSPKKKNAIIPVLKRTRAKKVVKVKKEKKFRKFRTSGTMYCYFPKCNNSNINHKMSSVQSKPNVPTINSEQRWITYHKKYSKRRNIKWMWTIKEQ